MKSKSRIEDIQLLNQKYEAGMYSLVDYEGKAANYGSNLPGQGAEFTPVSVAGQIIDQVNLLSKVRGHHQLFNATSDPFKIPLLSIVRSPAMIVSGSRSAEVVWRLAAWCIPVMEAPQ